MEAKQATMARTVKVIYENGVFGPLEPIDDVAEGEELHLEIMPHGDKVQQALGDLLRPDDDFDEEAACMRVCVAQNHRSLRPSFRSAGRGHDGLLL